MSNFVKVRQEYADDSYKPNQCYKNAFKGLLFIFPSDRYVLGYLHFRVHKKFKHLNMQVETSPVLHAWNRFNFGTHTEYVDFTPLNPRCIYQYEIITELSKSELDEIYVRKHGISIYDFLNKDMIFNPITINDVIQPNE